jgi:alpha-L-fucosidase 2
MSLSRRNFLASALAFTTLPQRSAQALPLPRPAPKELWFAQPARRWLEALPVGNGRLGGMVYGDPGRERIALSESTVWSGAPGSNEVNPTALPNLATIRKHFFDGDYEQAQSLCEKHLLGSPKNFGTNLPLPDLLLTCDEIQGQPADYRRSLSLSDALAKATYRLGDTAITHEIFASHPDEVLVVRLSAGKPHSFNFHLSFSSSDLPAKIEASETNTLTLRGNAFEHLHSSGHDGVEWQITAHVDAELGTVTAANEKLTITNATAVTILVAVGTNFQNKNPERLCAGAIARASAKSYEAIRKAHIADHQSLFDSVSLDLAPTDSPLSRRPTDVRRNALLAGAADPSLLALFFDYGRYLTIAGSRADSPLPLALQGIWNDGLASSMGWTDDFHLDINTQQNYWAAEVCGLGECQTPLFNFIETLRDAGRITAREMYGAPGWVAHTVTNPWGYTAPGWGTGWGLCVMAGVWIAQQLWRHYEFTADIEFLRNRAYPALREAALFFLAYTTPEPTHGWLVTGPSDSPENWYLSPAGYHIAESMGNTFDRVFVHALYSECIAASKTLATDIELRTKLEASIIRLPPFQIGRHGQLQEWLHDFDEAEPNHRHTSHLTALYPEHQISPDATPELARAAEVTIERRMNSPRWEQSEWGRANLIAYYARLLKPEDAHKQLIGLIANAADDNLLTFSSAGVAGATQNIFSLDGNTAGTAGIAEMLLQSHAGAIVLLPSLPSAWSAGSFRGLCTHGGYRVDVAWRGGGLVSARIVSARRGKVSVRYGAETISLQLMPGRSTHLTPSSFREAMKVQSTYVKE